MADDALVAPGRAKVRISTASGRITVVGEARDDIVVTTRGRTATTAVGDAVEVVESTSSSGIDVRCPVGTDVVVGSVSGNIDLTGHLGAVRVTNASGSIRVESVASADLRTQSGRIEVDECLAACRVMNRSGRIEVHRAGVVEVKGVSGTIDVAGDDVRVRTVSGRVRIAMTTGAAVETVSGKVEVSVPSGFHPRLRSHSPDRIRIDVPQGDDGEIAVRTVSASVRVPAR